MFYEEWKKVRLMNSPMTLSWTSMDLEKHKVRRAKRFSRVRKNWGSGVQSIECNAWSSGATQKAVSADKLPNDPCSRVECWTFGARLTSVLRPYQLVFLTHKLTRFLDEAATHTKASVVVACCPPTTTVHPFHRIISSHTDRRWFE